jgi:hypothetical protein
MEWLRFAVHHINPGPVGLVDAEGFFREKKRLMSGE